MKKFVFVLFVFISIKLFAQDTLPKFSAIVLGEQKARISWTNPFPNCTQLSVQKSYDSLKFFQTIFSSLSPELPQNGYLDNNYLSQIKIYYRIFYVLEDGKYFFTASKTAQRTATFTKEKTVADSLIDKQKINLLDSARFINLINTPTPTIKRMISIYKRNTDTLFNVFDEARYHRFKDSIAHKTKDTLYAMENDIVVWKPFVSKPLWKSSLNIYTTEDGYVLIELPYYKTHQYKVVFYDDKQQEIFKIKQLKQSKLMLEKSNFLHAGWFYFELFEDDKIKEKNKFFIERDF